MSRVECDHCGARYELPGEASGADQAGSGPTATCRECGAPARKAMDDHSMTPTPIAALRDSASVRDASGDGAQEEPPTARSPTTTMLLEDALEDEKTIALPVASAAAAAEQGKAANAAAATLPDGSSASLEDAAEDEVPISATPSMDLLVRRGRPEPSPRPKATAPKAGAFLESEYDLRPPDIQLEPSPAADRVTPSAATRTVKTDAPVAASRRPPAPSKSTNRSGVVIGLLLSAGAVFFAMRGIKSSDDELPPLPAAPPTLEEATRSVPDDAQKPSEPVAVIESPSPPVQAPPPAPALPVKETNVRPSLTQAPRNAAVIPASLTKGEEAAPSPTTLTPTLEAPADMPFNTDAASSALDKAVVQARTCRNADDPSGVATVTITFSPSGRVTTATISGPPFAGTETGSCIASRLRATRVPAFSGDFITVKKTVTIQ